MKIILLVICTMIVVSRSEKQLFGGQTAKLGQFKFYVSINNSRTVCGASYVSECCVLTAASCLKGHDSVEMLVTTSIYEVQHSYHTKWLESSRFIIHDDPNSIAIVKFPYAIQPYFERQYVKIPKKISIKTGTKLTTTGFNAKSNLQRKLQFATVHVVDKKECESLESSENHKNWMCVKAAKKNETLCGGDEGAPILLGNTDKQIGVSLGWNDQVGCSVERPNWAINITNYLDWIVEKTKMKLV